METIIKQSADGIVLSGDNNFDTTQGKVFINNHEITDIDTFFKVAEENTRLLEQVKKQKEVIDKATNELFILKDMIYKPETREENFEIQRKISSIIKRLNGKEVE